MAPGVQATHFPFKGGAEAMTEVIAGRIDFFFVALGPALPHIRSGRLSALAVNGTRRSASLPDVPTTSEAGFVDVEYPIRIGMVVPARTPRDVVGKLHRQTLEALENSRVKASWRRSAPIRW